MNFPDLLKREASVIEELNHRTGFKVSSVKGLVVKHGRPFDDKQPVAEKMEQHACYMNAFKMATSDLGLIYCEGYINCVIPIEHAWVVTKKGEVIDPTLGRKPKYDYFGIPFNTKFVVERALKTKVYGIFGEILQQDQIDWLKTGSLPEGAVHQFS